MSDSSVLIVTGLKDAGLNCVCQVLEALGVQVAGGKTPDLSLPMREQMREKVKRWYPRGSYITPEMLNGIKDSTALKGKAIKLLLPGLVKSVEVESKIIFCVRSPISIRLSRRKYRGIDIPIKNIKREYEAFEQWLSNCGRDLIVVDHEELRQEPATQVCRLANFLGRSANEEAIGSVDQDEKGVVLRWSEKDEAEGKEADTVYANVIKLFYKE